MTTGTLLLVCAGCGTPRDPDDFVLVRRDDGTLRSYHRGHIPDDACRAAFTARDFVTAVIPGTPAVGAASASGEPSARALAGAARPN